MTLDYIITIDYREHGPFTRLGCRSEKERGWRHTTHDWVVGGNSDDIIYIYFRPFSVSGPFAEAKVQVLFTRGRRKSACLFSLHRSLPSSWPVPRLPRSRLLPWAQTSVGVSDLNETGAVSSCEEASAVSSGLVFKMSLHWKDRKTGRYFSWASKPNDISV